MDIRQKAFVLNWTKIVQRYDIIQCSTGKLLKHMMRTLLCVYQVSKHIGYKTFTKNVLYVKIRLMRIFRSVYLKNITYGVWMHEYVFVLLMVMMAVMSLNTTSSMILTPSKYSSHLFFLCVIEDIPQSINEIQFRFEENCNQKNIHICCSFTNFSTKNVEFC